jgi:hypothetical protein
MAEDQENIPRPRYNGVVPVPPRKIGNGVVPAPLRKIGGKKQPPRPRMKETSVQSGVINYLQKLGRPDMYWFHVGNGGFRRPIEAAIMKGQGVKAGVPDIILICGGQTYGLELKAEGGRLSPQQKTTQADMIAAGAKIATATGIDEAVATLQSWGLLRKFV